MTVIDRARNLAAMWNPIMSRTAEVLNELADKLEAVVANIGDKCPPGADCEHEHPDDLACAKCWRKWLEG